VWNDAYRPLFMLTLIPGLAVVALLIFGLREPPVTTRAAKPFSLTLRPFDRRFRFYLVALALFTLGNASDAFLLVRAGELGVGVAWLPVLWCVFHIVKSSGSIVAGRWVDRIGPRPLILAGWLLYAAIYAAFAFADAAWHVWALFLTYGVFHALTEPAERAMVANLVGPENRGLAYGWYNFAIGIMTLPASLIFGWLYQQQGPLPAFGFGAGLAVASCAMLVAIRSPASTSEIHTPKG
jgi:predicted MFS family arabinose efflux permease